MLRLSVLCLCACAATVVEAVVMVRHSPAKARHKRHQEEESDDSDIDLDSEFDQIADRKGREKLNNLPSYLKSRFRSKSRISVTLLVSHGSKETPRGMDEQVNDWFTTDDKAMLAKGWKTWSSVEDGFIFKHKSAGQALQCQPAAGSRDLGMALELNMDCEISTEKPVVEFLQRTKKKKLWGKKEAKTLASFWHKSCDGHVPFCNTTKTEDPDDDAGQQMTDSIWGDFDFAFFAVDTSGFYGCDIITEDYCELPIQYPFIQKNEDMAKLTKKPNWHELEAGGGLKANKHGKRHHAKKRGTELMYEDEDEANEASDRDEEETDDQEFDQDEGDQGGDQDDGYEEDQGAPKKQEEEPEAMEYDNDL